MPQNRTDKRPLRIAQITDTHLFDSADGTLLGLNTRDCLDQVIKLAQQDTDFDLVVASGDLAHDGSEAAYLQVREQLGQLGIPVYCLAGNHDEGRAIREHLHGNNFFCVRSELSGGWQLVFLDSTIKNNEGGHLSTAELEALSQALDKHPDLPAMVWLHHQPVPMGSRWLDTMAVDNPDDFFAVIDRHPQVRAIVWGHVHQTFEQKHNNVRLLSSPSTCLQFLPDSEDFAVDEIPPGYRWLELYPDGSLKTGVKRLADIPGHIDLSARGY
ncbi:3',5'-cyclic-nucleotide phosphodiesterase [hydrothermal vent metagenome]|uniref:3',5'-cyclic-nucleotide phosphodiesterase n=1 Tax=hydrothermal vent metagenome TaxID=652676 RepID=A0A3B0YPA3_9ZZZZ